MTWEELMTPKAHKSASKRIALSILDARDRSAGAPGTVLGRPALVVAAMAVVVSLAVGVGSASAATPSTGSVGPSSPNVSWTGPAVTVKTAEGTDIHGVCPEPPNGFCDDFSLTVDVPQRYWDTHAGGVVVDVTGVTTAEDFDLHVYDRNGTLVASSHGPTGVESALIESASAELGPYKVRVVYFTTVDEGLGDPGYRAAARFDSREVECRKPAAAYDSGGSPGTGFPNDPLYPRQWGLRQIDAPGAWSQGALGHRATIAVIDTGVDLEHPDLRKKLVGGADLLQGGPGQPRDCPRGPQDDNGHGTHVAGIAAADTDNRIGVAGVAPRALVMPFKAGRANLSFDLNAGLLAIRRAAEDGADVLNLSWGQRPPNSVTDAGTAAKLEAAVDYAWSLGAVVVAAAGNDSFPLCAPPARSTRAVCVAATDSRGAPSWYSDLPLKQDLGSTLALRAPGGGLALGRCEDDEDIWSTVLPGSFLDSPCSQPTSDASPGDNILGYDTAAGTSMAAPHVAGVAALLAARGLSNHEIVECLRQTSSNRGLYDPVMGYGIVNAAAAVRECSSA